MLLTVLKLALVGFAAYLIILCKPYTTTGGSLDSTVLGVSKGGAVNPSPLSLTNVVIAGQY